ncbi:MAG: FkbM family methyltransferase [Gemmatimonadaceae bacterium]|jgi:FkbM family methyltransferase
MRTISLTKALRALRRNAMLHGLARLGERRRRILAWRVMQAAGVSEVTFTRDGLTWRVPAGDSHIGFGLFVEGGFAQGAIEVLLAWLQAQGRAPGPEDVIVDIGANIGTTCIPMVRACGCRAVAVEPMPEIVARLRDNVDRNGMADRIVLVEAAIARTAGRVVMQAGHDIGAATVVPPLHAAAINRGDLADVVGMPLSELLTRAGVHPSEVALVWADAQGSESDVIETGEALWARGVPLWAEFEPGLLAQHGGVEAFFAATRRHFDRFIEAPRLLRDGPSAAPHDIARLPAVLAGVPIQTDVLLLSPSLSARLP